jgi:hypothetical protein
MKEDLYLIAEFLPLRFSTLHPALIIPRPLILFQNDVKFYVKDLAVIQFIPTILVKIIKDVLTS